MEFDHPEFLSVIRLVTNDLTPEEKYLASALHNQGRYSGVPMIHRPTLLTHTLEVEALVMRLGTSIDELGDNGLCNIDFDHFRAVTGSKIHDLEEIMNDDWATTTKEQLTQQEKAEHAKKEKLGLSQVFRLILNVNNQFTINSALNLYEEVRQKQTPAAQLVEVADKYAALIEKCFEIFCGNNDFIPLLESSRRRFERMPELEVWEYIIKDPAFDFHNIPSAEQVAKLPKIDQRMLVGDENGKLTADGRYVGLEVLESGPILEWPNFFQEGAYVRGVTFPRYTKEFIFPGWYPDLSEKLGLSSLEL